jgi:hypothetical protein
LSGQGQGSPSGQVQVGTVTTPAAESDRVPDVEYWLPPKVDVPLNVPDVADVPFRLIVSLTVAVAVAAPAPETKILACHGPAKSAIEYGPPSFVRIMRLVEPSDQVSVHASTVLPESIWHREFSLVAVSAIPLEEIKKAPLPLLTLLGLSVAEKVNFPSVATVSVTLSHQGASGPVAKALAFHVPAKSARVTPLSTLAANANAGDRQITQMKMNSPYRCFDKLALRISGPPR